MIRLAPAAALCLAAMPALAWEAGRDGALCTLTHIDPAGAEVRLTYDPAGPLYTITVTRDAPWPDAPDFGISFDGGAALTITTDRHVLSGDGRALTVTDRGFGNVLRGLSRNDSATVFAGPAALSLSLDGAAPEVAEFAACETAPSA
jgi:YD repeat-containing protein